MESVPQAAPESTQKQGEEHIPAEASNGPEESEEYDSAGSYASDQDKQHSRRNSSVSSEGDVGLERQSGDGQESQPSRKVDDDEDKKNPQYIPKKGTFYEHDDRTLDDEETEEKEVEAEKDKDGKSKKVWQDKKEKWSHDKFDDSEQAPKSKSELVAIYGYDIRNEDGPPRARRRRRYGRGPNKYTRNWEDEAAYTKPPTVRTTKKPPPRKGGNGREYHEDGSREEFPPLPQELTSNSNRDLAAGRDRDYGGGDSGEAPENGNDSYQAQPSASGEYSARQQQPRVGSGRVVKPKREIKDSDYKGFTTKTRQVRNMKTDQKIVSRGPIRREDFIQSQNFTNTNKSIQDLDKDLSKLSVQDGGYSKPNNQRQGSVPPRLQNEQKGSKRYSSIRQRSLPESATPPFNQHSNYYSNAEYSQQGQVPLSHQNTPPQVPQIAPPPLPPIQQVPVTATPILQPPQFAPPFPPQPTPPFLPPGVPQAPFIAQPTPQLINYVPNQPQFQSFQGFQQQFNPVTQPTELYNPASGITYYSTDQQMTQRTTAPQKRPKAAIPIIAPPTIEMKGKAFGEKDTGTENDLVEGQIRESSSNVAEAGAGNNVS